MHLTLLVPGLFWPREILRDTTFDLPHPALALLFGRGRHAALAAGTAWAGAGFGTAAPLPAAPLRLIGEGGEPGDHDWLCLDPVHLRIEERAIVLDDPARLELTAEEDEALREAVAPLAAPLSEIVARAPGHWHLRLAGPAAIDTADLPHGIGLPADPSLPAGPEGAAWRRRLAEIQPVLHDHPVNRRRAEAGRPTVNALWPWGGGRRPQTVATAVTTVWSNDPVLKGYASLADIAAAPMPEGFAPASGHLLAHFDGLAAARFSFDATAWREGLARLEAQWLAPALTAMRRGVLRRLSFVAGAREPSLRVDLGRADLWRLWRRPLPLADLPAP